MNVWSLSIVSILVVAALVATWRHARSSDAPGDAAEPAGPSRITCALFGFFGIGGVSLELALAVLWSTSAIATAALDAIATLHLASAYPAWFPANAVATGLGIGLLSTRLLAASSPSGRAWANGQENQVIS